MGLKGPDFVTLFLDEEKDFEVRRNRFGVHHIRQGTETFFVSENIAMTLVSILLRGR